MTSGSERTLDPERLQPLFTYCIDFARQMLADSGAFLPFGAVLRSTGEVTASGGWTGDEHPAPAEVYVLLQQAFTAEAKAGMIDAAALAVDVTIPTQFQADHSDGIRVLLESRGSARFVYLPYVVGTASSETRRLVTFAPPFAVETEPAIFID